MADRTRCGRFDVAVVVPKSGRGEEDKAEERQTRNESLARGPSRFQQSVQPVPNKTTKCAWPVAIDLRYTKNQKHSQNHTLQSVLTEPNFWERVACTARTRKDRSLPRWQADRQ